MTKTKWLRKAGITAAAFSLSLQFLPGALLPILAKEEESVSTSSSQMTSAPQVVYQNVYGTDRVENFNSNWKFMLDNPNGAYTSAYDDSSWQQVTLPHDYSIDQEYSSSLEAESGYLPGGIAWYRKSFTLSPEAAGKRVMIHFGGVYMNASVFVNGKEVGFHPYGYTEFSFDISDYLNYEGENTIAVQVANELPTSRWYSGSGIYRDVELIFTNQVHTSAEGVYVTSPDLEQEAASGNVTTRVQTDVTNISDANASVTVRNTVLDANGKSVGSAQSDAKTVGANEVATITTDVAAKGIKLWSTSDPNLYTVKTEILVDGNVVDTQETTMGYRYFAFDADTGFSLNGEKMKLKGVCMHHDQGSLGSESWDRAVERQVQILKQMGVNSIRVTHNPASQELLEACNREGILVINELFDTWTNYKNYNYYDYSEWFSYPVYPESATTRNEILYAEEGDTWAEFDTRSAVLASRNAPSVIMYSMGNELQEGLYYAANADEYKQITADMIDWIRENDTENVITFGDNKIKQNNTLSYNMADIIARAGGVVGLNYANGSQYDSAHYYRPNWFIVGSETASAVNSRGIYNITTDGKQTASKQLSSYDNSKVNWGAYASSAWYDVITRDFVAGEYVWTGFDYLGEPTPWNGIGGGAVGSWESPKNSYFGIIDTAGLPKDSYYLYQALWNDDVNTLHVLPAWNSDSVTKDENGNVNVVVYSDAASVELFYIDTEGNETSLGKKTFTKVTTDAGFTYQIYEGEDASQSAHKNLYLSWSVPYADGTIKAVAYDEKGNVITDTDGTSSRTTAGAAARLQAQGDRTSIAADGSDLLYVEINVLDANGNLVPDADNVVTVDVSGAGKLLALDNGSSPDHQSYTDDNRHAFSGKLIAIVQSTDTSGAITVTASAEGLESSSFTINSTAVRDESKPQLVSLEYSRSYYVKTGTMPELPQTVKAVYSDGSEKDLSVSWTLPAASELETPGTLQISGTADGSKLIVNVTVLEDIAAVQNYSTVVPTGTVPSLPKTRPILLADGTPLDNAFEIAWNMPDASVFNTPGIVTITGTVNVFGADYTVTATVRVADQTVTVGNNIANQATVTQDPANNTSGTLVAITDGTHAYTAGDNTTQWSNYSVSYPETSAKLSETSLMFTYDTQTVVGGIDVSFFQDSWSAVYPLANTITFEISNDGSTWEKIDATETIGQETGTGSKYKTYSYSFDPVRATQIRMNIKNAPDRTGLANPDHRTCTGITEVEIKGADVSLNPSTAAALESLAINGKAVSEGKLAAETIKTLAINPTVTAAGKDNAAVTVLPPYNGEVKILITSEDGMTTRTVTVKTVDEDSLTAADDALDVDTALLTATAASSYAGTASEGPADYVLDGKQGTWWHTDWAGGANQSASEDERWIQLTASEPVTVDALRYLSRAGRDNGSIANYRVEYKNDEGKWVTIASGRFDTTSDAWQLAEFETPVTAKEFRLYGVSTISNGEENNKWVSAAEIRLRHSGKENLAELENLSVEGQKTIYADMADESHPVLQKLTVKNGDTILKEGSDYTITYTGNTAFGNASAEITGIGAYSGSVSYTFDIVKKELVSSEMKTAPESMYKEGETFNPAGMVIVKTMNDGSTEELVYSAETAGQFEFGISLSEKLRYPDTVQTITAAGRTFEVPLTVEPMEHIAAKAESSKLDCDPADYTLSAGSSNTTAPLAADNDATTAWIAKEGDNSTSTWLQIDLPGAKTIGGLRLQAPEFASPIANYRIDAKAGTDADGNVIWRTVAKGSFEDVESGMWQITQFMPVETDSIRLYALGEDGKSAAYGAAEVRLIEPKTEKDPETDKTALVNAIAQAQSVKTEEEYADADEKAKADLEEALANAEAVNANADASQEEIDSAAAKVLAAIEALQIMQSKAPLLALVQQAQAVDTDLYADGAMEKEALKQAIENALAALEKADAQEMSAAYDALQNAIETVKALETVKEESIDTAALAALIDKVTDIKLEDYVQNETLAAFSKALVEAAEQLKEPESQEAVDAAQKALETAYAALGIRADDEQIAALEKALQEANEAAVQYAGKGYDETIAENVKNLENALVNAKAMALSKDDAKNLLGTWKELQDTLMQLPDETPETPSDKEEKPADKEENPAETPEKPADKPADKEENPSDKEETGKPETPADKEDTSKDDSKPEAGKTEDKKDTAGKTESKDTSGSKTSTSSGKNTVKTGLKDATAAVLSMGAAAALIAALKKRRSWKK